MAKKSEKKKAWTYFSKYIRLKHTDSNGWCKCVTCGAVDEWKKMQAGHFIDGRNNSVLFNETLVYPQCYGCNVCRNGNKVNYTLFMLQKHTIDEIKAFEGLKSVTKQIKESEYREIAEKYKEKSEKLQEKLGL